MSKVWYHRPAPIETQKERLELAQRIGASHETMREEFMRRRKEAEEARRKAKPSGKVAGYLKAEAKHALKGPAPAAVVEERIRACMACPGRADVYNGVKDEGGIGFCTKCGCPASQRSQLSVKLTLAGVSCPLGKFKAVEGTGGNAQTALEAAKGVVTSVVAQLRRALS